MNTSSVVNSIVSNSEARNTNVAVTGTGTIGRIAGENGFGATLINNRANPAMVLTRDGTVITPLVPTPANNNIHGADIG